MPLDSLRYTLRISRERIIIIVCLSSILSALVVNRWFVTELGFESYGRVWQQHLSYFDFGFQRRLFWGTFLSVTGINKVLGVYETAFLVHTLVNQISIFLIAIWMWPKRRRFTVVELIVILFSPALIMQSAYLLGSIDHVILALVLILSISRLKGYHYFLISLIGGLVSELYLICIPGILGVIYLKQYGDHFARKLWHGCALVGGTLVSVMSTWILPNKDFTRLEWSSIAANKLGEAVGKDKLFWDGYIQIIYPGYEKDISNIPGAFWINGWSMIFSYKLEILIVSLYLFAIALLFFITSRNLGVRERFILLALALSSNAWWSPGISDLYRLMGISCNFILVYLMLNIQRLDFSKERIIGFLVVLPFSMYISIGGGEFWNPLPIWAKAFG